MQKFVLLYSGIFYDMGGLQLYKLQILFILYRYLFWYLYTLLPL